MDVSLSELRELVMDREAWFAAIHGVAKSRTRLSDWTDWTELRFVSIPWDRPIWRVTSIPGISKGKSSISNNGDGGAAAAAAPKSLQSCLTLCNPINCSPPGFPVPGILQARTLEWVAIPFSSAWKWKLIVKSLSRVQLLLTPWTTAYNGFSRQEYWSGVPLPSPQ